MTRGPPSTLLSPRASASPARSPRPGSQHESRKRRATAAVGWESSSPTVHPPTSGDSVMSSPGFPLWQPLNTAFRSEAALAEWVYQELEPYFVVHRQVRGTHCTGHRLQIDAVLRPREPLGWTDPAPAFGVEIKTPSRADGTKTYTKWAAQAVHYTHTD